MHPRKRRPGRPHRLLRAARVGTLATTVGGQPFASLVTPATAPDLSLLLLLSSLSEHTRHLRADPRCSILVAGAATGANPQTAPRLTVTGQARPEPDPALKARWLAVHPYAALYADFSDFGLWRIAPIAGLLVGGFARATRLRQSELTPDAAAVAAIEAAAAGDHRPLQHRPSGCAGRHRGAAGHVEDGRGRCRWLRPGVRRDCPAGRLVGAGRRPRRRSKGVDSPVADRTGKMISIS